MSYSAVFLLHTDVCSYTQFCSLNQLSEMTSTAVLYCLEFGF